MLFVNIFFTILVLHLVNMKPDLVPVVTAHTVDFCAFTRSEIFQKIQGIRGGLQTISSRHQWVNV